MIKKEKRYCFIFVFMALYCIEFCISSCCDGVGPAGTVARQIYTPSTCHIHDSHKIRIETVRPYNSMSYLGLP
jgi:hypothetical protein